MHNTISLLFLAAFGISTSGIVLNVYRVAEARPTTAFGNIIAAGVTIFAGPVMLLENSTRSYRAKRVHTATYSLAIAGAMFWALITGSFMFILWSSI